VPAVGLAELEVAVPAFAVAVTATPEASGGRFTNDDQNGFGAGDGLSRPVCPTADTAG